MQFFPENFPLYKILQDMKFPGAENAKKDFEAAAKGGVEERYGFAMGLFTVTQVPELSKKVPVITDAIVQLTKAQVYLIMKEGGEQGHQPSTLMAAFLKATGQGTKEDREGALELLDKADKTGVTPFSAELRKQLTPATYITKGPRPAV